MAGTANNNAKKNIREKVINRFIDEPPFDVISGSRLPRTAQSEAAGVKINGCGSFVTT
jgi:hypothetical protein